MNTISHIPQHIVHKPRINLNGNLQCVVGRKKAGRAKTNHRIPEVIPAALSSQKLFIFPLVTGA
jgi:hypothetical protein